MIAPRKVRFEAKKKKLKMNCISILSRITGRGWMQ